MELFGVRQGLGQGTIWGFVLVLVFPKYQLGRLSGSSGHVFGLRARGREVVVRVLSITFGKGLM